MKDSCHSDPVVRRLKLDLIWIWGNLKLICLVLLMLCGINMQTYLSLLLGDLQMGGLSMSYPEYLLHSLYHCACIAWHLLK